MICNTNIHVKSNYNEDTKKFDSYCEDCDSETQETISDFNLEDELLENEERLY